MSVEGEACSDAVEQKLTTFSPSMQSDLSLDGDGSTNQNNSSSNDKFSHVSANSQVASEPKAKKRRKQSNPLKIQNATSPKFDLPSFDISEQNESESNSATPYFVEDESLNQNHVAEKNKVSDLSSQKGSIGSLAKVTTALYNNKIKEAAKANKVGNKSKESSLSSCQSITDISSPESSEEVATNNEYKQPLQNQFSHMPPLLPMNPVEISDTSKLSVVPYPFSEFPTSIPQGNTLSITHRSFITSSGVRVFNPEAYCELCEKEFCNKYFLKTHKANKHGICSVDNNYSSHNYRQYKNVHVNPQTSQQMMNQFCETGAMFGSADSYCNICQKYFCNKYFLKKHRQNIHGIQENQEMPSNTPSSIHVPVISSPLPLVRPAILENKPVDVSSGHPTKDEDSKINVSLENIKNSLNSNIPLLNGSSPHTSSQNKTNFANNDAKEKKNEKFLCEICNIEFCDKCYLDSHKQNKHGLLKVTTAEFPENSEEAPEIKREKSHSPDDGDETNFKEQMCAPCMKTFSTSEAFQNHMLEVHVASIKDEDDVSRLSDTVNKKPVVGGFDKDLTRVDKSPSMQEVENSNSSNESGSFNCNFCLMKCKDRSSYLNHMETEHNFSGLLGSDSGQETYSCDTCQEQFPDRLTLMSHKYKNHGIITPGFEECMENGEFSYLTGMKQKTGASSFCTICNKELCNKYFMKTHMMKMHGIGLDKNQQERWSSPSGSGGVYCDICQKLLCSKYFLKVHKQNVHGIIVDESQKQLTVGSPMYTNNNVGVNMKKLEKNYPGVGKVNQAPVGDTIVGKEDPIKGKIYTCDLCGQEFSSKLLLQCHLVEKHVKLNDSKSTNSVMSYPKLPEESKDTPKRVLPCSCCLFINLGDNLQAEIGHELKLISCIVCNITYQQSDYHAHHLSHGTALPLAKKLNLENGVHEPGTDYSNSGNNSFDLSKNKLRPRKFKRFRCSKCDKTFRTKVKCLHHIQVMHKSKKSLLNQCDQQTPPKKAILNNTVCRKNSEVKTLSGTENGSGLMRGKEAKDVSSLLSSGFHEAAPLPVPYVLPKNSDVIMQPFHLSEPKPEGVTKQDIFVPSLVYLPVSQKVSEPVTVAFTLTPA